MKTFFTLSKVLSFLFFTFLFENTIAQEATAPKPRINTVLYYTDPYLGLITADGVTTIYDNSYCECVDHNDALNFTNPEEDIAILRHGQKLSIETRPLIATNDTTALNIVHMKTQSYWWQFNVSGGFSAGMTGVLVDTYTGTKSPVSLIDTTVIHFDVDLAIPASMAPDRFYVVYMPQAPLPVTITGIKAYPHNTGVNVGWGVSQQINMGTYEIQRATAPGSFISIGRVSASATTGQVDYSFYDANPAIGPNFYKIKATDLNGAVTYSTVAKVVIGGTPPAIAVYPNPVTGNTFTLQLNNVASGNYTIMLINAFGQIVFTDAISYPGGSGSQLINVNRRLAPGLYLLKMGSLSTQIIKQ